MILFAESLNFASPAQSFGLYVSCSKIVEVSGGMFGQSDGSWYSGISARRVLSTVLVGVGTSGCFFMGETDGSCGPGMSEGGGVDGADLWRFGV